MSEAGLPGVTPERVEFVLVRPVRGANVAAASRALKNMGYRRLCLVSAAALEPQQRALAYGAWDVLDAARRVATLEEAVASATLVAATSARPGPEHWTPRRLAEQSVARAGGGCLAIVFGPESHGLTRRELELCHLQVTIPSHADHPSLNLAQAVLVLAYELRLAGLAPAAREAREARAADAATLERTLGELRGALLGIGYLNRQRPERVLAELRRLLARAGPTPREIALLRGLARQIAWAAGRIAERGGSGG
jgi:TrmH family RNA methyltransferase